MMATICGRFRLELDPQMGGEAGVLERQISSFTLAVDGGLFLQFHDRTQVGPSHDPPQSQVFLGQDRHRLLSDLFAMTLFLCLQHTCDIMTLGRLLPLCILSDTPGEPYLLTVYSGISTLKRFHADQGQWPLCAVQ